MSISKSFEPLATFVGLSSVDKQAPSLYILLAPQGKLFCMFQVNIFTPPQKLISILIFPSPLGSLNIPASAAICSRTASPAVGYVTPPTPTRMSASSGSFVVPASSYLVPVTLSKPIGSDVVEMTLAAFPLVDPYVRQYS